MSRPKAAIRAVCVVSVVSLASILLTITSPRILFVSKNVQVDSSGREELEEENRTASKICSQESRKTLLKNMCKTYKYFDKTVHKALPQLIVDHHHKVAYCYIAKNGCSSWKTIMANVSSAGKVKPGMSLAELRNLHNSLKKYGLEEMRYNDTIAGYTKFMVVRHPLDRLVSAYRDKMRGGDVTYNNYAKTVVEKFRTNNMTNNDTYPTFQEFVKMLFSGVSLSYNEHWVSYFYKCDPCNVHYDYILKLETMEHDMDMLLSNVFAQDLQYISNKKINSFAPSGDKAAGSKYSKQLDLFKELSKDQVDAVQTRFQLESDFFGYSFNQKTLTTGCCDVTNKSIWNLFSPEQCCC